MRILWLGNAPMVGSGYGEQAGLFLPRLKNLGHDLAVACNYGIQGWKADWNGLTLYPADNDWGNSTLATFAADHKADLVIALCDAWVLHPDKWPPGLPPVAVWAPVDHDPCPPQVVRALSHPTVTPIAMSRFGEAAMKDEALKPLYVPHGVDTNTFKPDPDVRRQIRQQFGIPQDAYLVGMVAANKGNPSISRKGFPQAFDAFARFAADHKDAWLFVHSDPLPHPGGGIDLGKLALAVSAPEDRVRMTPPQAWHLPSPPTLVAALLTAFDVLLSPSMGEGFGIPVLEAQACGTPVIVSDHSAMSELCGAGWKVGGDRWWDALQDSFFISPSIPHIHAALELAYAERANEELHTRGREFALAYDADRVTEEFWQPVLDTLANTKRTVPPLNMNGNRADRRRAERAAKKRKVAA